MGIKIHEVKTDRNERRNRQFNNNNRWLQYPAFNNGENNEAGGSIGKQKTWAL